MRYGVQDDDGLGGRVLEVLDHPGKVEAARGLNGEKVVIYFIWLFYSLADSARAVLGQVHFRQNWHSNPLGKGQEH